MSIVQKDKFDTFKVLLVGSHLEIQNHCGINMKFGATIKSHEWYSRESSHFGNDYVIEKIIMYHLSICPRVFSRFIRETKFNCKKEN